ncbi:MAG TPA: GNAT family N-acetyltransferase [Bacteroidia bacterium]|nr:GNAT family N-acetyltransferase [Bacteroidia bacterium]
MDPDINILPITDDRITDLQKLFFLVFGKKHTVSYLQSKYDTSYLGVNHVAHLAYDGSNPVAFVGAIPMPFLLNGKKLTGVQYCDYMTLPQYRRKGIHTLLLEKNRELATKQGADFIFAMHTTNSANGDLRFAWNFQEPLNAYVIPLVTPAILQLVNRIQQFLSRNSSNSTKFHQQQIKWPQYAVADVVHVDYSEPFFRYKAFAGARIIELNKVFFWIKSGVVMEVGNIAGADNGNLKKSFEDLLPMASKMGCSRLIVQPRKNTPIDKFLKTQYTPVSGYCPAFQVLKPDLEIANLQLNYCDFDTF